LGLFWGGLTVSEDISLTGVERSFGKDDIIVSKTDLKGKITYANDTFLEIADYTESEVMGAPHSLIRHPEMPRAVFKLLWDTVQTGKEIFAYVVNRTKGGDHYWVLAHVTPDFDASGNVSGYHSNRRVPEESALAKVKPLYEQLRAEERHHSDPKTGLEASTKILTDLLEENGVPYDQFILSL